MYAPGELMLGVIMLQNRDTANMTASNGGSAKKKAATVIHDRGPQKAETDYQVLVRMSEIVRP